MSRSAKDVAISVVLAIRDAEESVGRDVRRIAEHLRGRGLSFEILAVSDGCRDNSLAVVRLLARQVPELRVCPGCARARRAGARSCAGPRRRAASS
jgi:glycosyltransferase involved in cell wall biosynthesis